MNWTLLFTRCMKSTKITSLVDLYNTTNNPYFIVSVSTFDLEFFVGTDCRF